MLRRSHHISLLVLLCSVLFSYSTNAQLATVSCPTPNFGYNCNSYGYNSQITNVTFNNVSHNPTGCYQTGGAIQSTFNVLNIANASYPLSCNFAIASEGYWVYWQIWIDWNNNGVFGPGEQVYNNYNGTLNTTVTIPPGTASGPKRMRVLHSFWYWDYYDAACTAYYGYDDFGDFKDYQINLNPPLPDAGISTISTTSPPPFAAGTNTITATLRNYGQINLTSTTINWTVNGAAQTPIAWTGSLAGGGSATVNLTSYNFPAVGPISVRAWTTAPNNTTDGNVSNDSSVVTPLGSALNGTYTIGGSNPDFATLKIATDQLSAGGTSGSVTFNIRPGTYTGYHYITNPPGNQSARPITIQADASASGSRDNVIIQHDGGATQSAAINATSITSGQPTVRLQNVDFITFNNVTVAATGTGAANWAQCVELMGNTTAAGDGCDNVTFSNCGFTGRVAAGFFNNDLLFFSQAAAHQNLQITGSTFTNGASSIFIWRGTTPFVTGIRITNNTLTNFAANGISSNVTDGLVMTGNTLRTTSSLLNTGINIANNIGNFVMSKNRVFINNTGATTIPAILFQARTNTNPGRPMVSNNFIRVNGNTWGVRTSGSSNTDFVHNTVYSTSSTTPIFSNEGASNGYAIVNNVIYNAGGGQVANNVSGS
ncbi:MAG: hypothetical protein JNL32_15430, partial [Candidatus Kapabacteria bacterium]|nr:hypothetical protein [Candidatus Kapabacteria bacterium]